MKILMISLISLVAAAAWASPQNVTLEGTFQMRKDSVQKITMVLHKVKEKESKVSYEGEATITVPGVVFTRTLTEPVELTIRKTLFKKIWKLTVWTALELRRGAQLYDLHLWADNVDTTLNVGQVINASAVMMRDDFRCFGHGRTDRIPNCDVFPTSWDDGTVALTVVK